MNTLTIEFPDEVYEGKETAQYGPGDRPAGESAPSYVASFSEC